MIPAVNAKLLFAGIAIFLLTIGAGAYAKEFRKSEQVSFSVAVPAGTIDKPMQVKGGGQQVSMAPVSVNLAGRSLLKTTLNGGIEAIATHRIVNVGMTPVRIHMDMVNSTIPVRWEVSADAPYNPATRTFTEPLMPGKSIPGVAVECYFDIPPEKIHEPQVYDGGIRFSDADSGELLTFLPVHIVNGDLSHATTTVRAQ